MVKTKELNLYYLLILIPPLLITGSFLPDLSLVILCFYFLFKQKVILKKYYDQSYLIKIFFYFSIYNILISFTSENFFVSFKSSITHLRFVVFIICFVYIFEKLPKIKIIFFWVLLASIFILSVDAIVQFYFKTNFLGFSSNSVGRISGLFGDEYILGSYLFKMLILLISIKSFLSKKKEIKVNKILFNITLVFAFFSIIFSGERTSVISMIIFIFMYIFFIDNKGILKKIYIFFIFILILFSTTFLNDSLKSRYVDLSKKIIFLLNNEDSSNLDGLYATQNIKHILVSFKMIKEKPFLGHGNKMFAKVCFERYFVNDGRCSTHPHNFLTQILVENGIFGAIFFLLVFIHFLKVFFSNCFNRLEKNKSLLIVALGCIIVYFPLLPSGSFFNNWLNINIFFLISFFTYLSINLKKRL